MTVKKALIKQYSNDILEYLQMGVADNTAEFDDTEYMLACFRDIRENGSLLLTDFGIKMMSKYYPNWECDITDIKTKDLLFLINKSKLPFWHDKTKFVTFDKNVGVVMVMSDGNFDLLYKN